MKQYLLSIDQPDGPIPPPEMLGPIMQKVEALAKGMKAADGYWPPSVGHGTRKRRRRLKLGSRPLLGGAQWGFLHICRMQHIQKPTNASTNAAS
ncbi:MAG: hypothetical protein EYC70_13465 [Planctomycetota bacterium]|nr:MAG: hypothetical protein EYC70_13465 [Planctomycetota bacterium]